MGLGSDKNTPPYKNTPLIDSLFLIRGGILNWNSPDLNVLQPAYSSGQNSGLYYGTD